MDFPPAFLVIGAVTAAAGLVFARLAPDAGAELAGREADAPTAIEAKPGSDRAPSDGPL